MMADWIQAAETTKASDRACHHRRIKPSQKSHSLTSIMLMLVSTVDGEISGSELIGTTADLPVQERFRSTHAVSSQVEEHLPSPTPCAVV